MFCGDTGRAARVLHRALVRLNLASLGISPHSARVGFATNAIGRRVPFQELTTAGRRQGDQSLQVYVDAIMSRVVSPVPSVARWRRLGEEVEVGFLTRI